MGEHRGSCRIRSCSFRANSGIANLICSKRRDLALGSETRRIERDRRGCCEYGEHSSSFRRNLFLVQRGPVGWLAQTGLLDSCLCRGASMRLDAWSNLNCAHYSRLSRCHTASPQIVANACHRSGGCNAAASRTCSKETLTTL